jgi:hypothetical protein
LVESRPLNDSGPRCFFSEKSRQGRYYLSKPDPIAGLRKLELRSSSPFRVIGLWDGTGELRWLVLAGCGTN